MTKLLRALAIVATMSPHSLTAIAYRGADGSPRAGMVLTGQMDEPQLQASEAMAWRVIETAERNRSQWEIGR